MITTTSIRSVRNGFTLIELLIVLAIIALIAALSAGALVKVISVQELNATTSTMTKINTNLDRRWKAILDQAGEDARKQAIPPQIVNFADNDLDRARVIWAYMLLKNEFPTSFAEAKSAITVGGYVLRPRSVFNQLPMTGGTPEEQSAACLYLALTETANRGEAMGTDGLDSQTTDLSIGTQQLRVFKDAWGKPIAFVRMAYSPEINSAPVTKTSNVDPIDPKKTLTRAGTNWNATTLATFWTAITVNHIPTGTGTLPSPYAAQNWVCTTVSGGPDTKFGIMLNPPPSTATTADPGLDNVLGFRLRQQGAQGN